MKNEQKRAPFPTREENREKLQKVYDKMAGKPSPLKRLLTSPRAMARFVAAGALYTLVLYYLCPRLYEVTFTGTLLAAAESALVMLVIGHIGANIATYEVRESIRRMASQQKYGSRFSLTLLGILLVPSLEIAAICFFPGSLALHGFWGFVLAGLALFVLTGAITSLASRVFPDKSKEAQEAKEIAKELKS